MLTILIPNYGRTRYVERLIRQIVAESEVALGQVKLVVSDNCSPPETQATLRLLIEEYGHLDFELHEQPTNIGGVENSKWLINHASTRFVWVIGSDDMIAPGAVGHVLSLLQQYDPGVLHLPHAWHWGDESLCPPSPEVFASGRELFLAYTHWLSFMSACVVKHECLLEAMHDVPTPHTWGPHMWYALAGRGQTCVVAERRLVTVGDARNWHAHGTNEILTTPLITAFDAGFHLLVNEWEYGRLFLDRRDADWHTPLWELAQLDELKAAVRRFPSSRWLRRRLFELTFAGEPEHQGDDVREAVELLRWAVAETEDADEIRALVEHGEALYAQGELVPAVQQFAAILGIDPANAEVLCDLGVVRSALGDPEAIKSLEFALECDPEWAAAYANRAFWAQRQGLRSLAVTDARRAVELDPGMAEWVASILASIVD